MIKIENVEVHGLNPAIRGMRNPLESWDRSDSRIYQFDELCSVIGDNDMDLMNRLFKSGTEHRKYLRMINAYMDITAPLYWWKEFDTYKVGTVANSCSTMHKIHDKEFTLDDFSWEQLLNTNCDLFESYVGNGMFKTIVQPQGLLLDYIIPSLNICREKYLETKDKNYWWQMIQLLPSSYNQKRTVMINYEVAVNIIKQRSTHKLDEWHTFVDELNKLPWIADITKLD